MPLTTTAPRKPRSSLSAPCLFTLKIELCLEQIQPPIWRRLEVDGRISLAKLHHFIQAAMGWADAHLHEFEIRGQRYAPLLAEADDASAKDEKKFRLNQLFIAGEQYLYRYDLGDDWAHRISVEAYERIDNDPDYEARVIDGARACPPEDVGGATGYHDFLEKLLAAPESGEAQALRLWAGGEFDAERFDRRAANAAIQRLLWNRWGGK
jgi:hypothetical protein